MVVEQLVNVSDAVQRIEREVATNEKVEVTEPEPEDDTEDAKAKEENEE